MIINKIKEKTIKYRTLVVRSLTHYRRAHTAVFLGVMVSTAVLTGALVVGDSVRYSLRQLALTRLGRVEFALAAQDRFVRAGLAEDIAENILGLYFATTRFYPSYYPAS